MGYVLEIYVPHNCVDNVNVPHSATNFKIHFQAKMASFCLPKESVSP